MGTEGQELQINKLVNRESQSQAIRIMQRDPVQVPKPHPTNACKEARSKVILPLTRHP